MCPRGYSKMSSHVEGRGGGGGGTTHNCDIYCYKIIGSIVSSVRGEGAGKNCHFMRDVIFE